MVTFGLDMRRSCLCALSGSVGTLVIMIKVLAFAFALASVPVSVPARLSVFAFRSRRRRLGLLQRTTIKLVVLAW